MSLWKVGAGAITVVQADITRLAVDAVVNAANSELWMGGGVAGAIKRAGGSSIEHEAQARGPIPVGEAVVTGAGRLPCRHVIHAATMGPDLATDAPTIQAATLNALRRADELGLSSIAFPALGTGVGGFPLEDAARLMVTVVVRHLQDGSALQRVIFAVFSADAERAFGSVLEEIIHEAGGGQGRHLGPPSARQTGKGIGSDE